MFSTEEKIEIYNTIFTATDIQISIGIFFHISLFRISSQKQLKITKHPQQKLLHMSVKLSFEINTWGFGAAIFRERPLSVLFHSSSLTSTFNPKARSAWGPTLIQKTMFWALTFDSIKNLGGLFVRKIPKIKF